NTPFRKYKRYLHEGGVITPCIISWPAKITPQRGYHQSPGYITDLVPTALELAGVAADNTLPGLSLSPLWTGKEAQERTYYWEHEGNRAIRKGDWKLVKDKEDAEWALYDLLTDPGARNGLAGEDADRVAAMKQEYTQWADNVGVRP